MVEAIENFMLSIFGNNVVLATILIATIPVIELKGAIPFAMSSAIWKGYELSFGYAFLWGVLGSSLVVPILVLLYFPIIKLLKKTKLFKKIATKIEDKINTKKQNVENKIEAKNNKSENKKTIFKVLCVFAFVALPLPFTGVWTGSCLAVALGLNFFLSCIVVILANMVAGILVCSLSTILSPLVYLLIFIALLIIFFVFFLIKTKCKKHNSDNIEISNQHEK